MPEVTVERRNSPRYSMVLAADVISLPGGAKMVRQNFRRQSLGLLRGYFKSDCARFPRQAQVYVSSGRVRSYRFGRLRQPESRYGHTIHASLGRPTGPAEPMAGRAAAGILTAMVICAFVLG